jgi:hypothetical protein
MTANGVFKTALLLLVAACGLALWMNARGKNQCLDVVISPDQVRTLMNRIDHLEDALRTTYDAARHEAHPGVSKASDVTRTEERSSDVVAVLQEIRDAVKALVDGQVKYAVTSADGVPKNTDSIAKVLQGDSVTETTLLHKHFCWTRAQVYSMYGFPDGRGGGVGVLQWTYRDEGSGHWLQFHFTDGVVSDVRMGQLSNR